MKSSIKGDQKNQPTSQNDEDLLKIVKDLQSKIATLEAAKGEKEVTEEDKEKQSLLDDYMDEPALFFAYSIRFSIFGDKRYGKSVETPDGKGVTFERAYRYEKRRPGQRGADIVSTCTVKVHSKRLANWLREHSLYGIKFFESFSDAENVNVTLAEKMVEINAQISHMSDMQVIERAKMTDGVHISADIALVRKQLIEKIAKDQLEAEGSNKKNAVKRAVTKEDKKIDEKAIARGAANTDVYG